MASKPKFEEELREDRISQMPDDVLLRILSLLDSTILAARTTVLSKRWNHLWLYIQKFSLSYEVPTGDETLADGYARIRRCICTLVEHNVVELDLAIVENGYADDDIAIDSPFLFPESLFMSKTLTVLKVNPALISFSNCPSKGCFPNLKVLRIDSDLDHVPWDDSLKVLFTCCPMLEDVTLTACSVLYQVSDIDICAPKLKTLRICLVTRFYHVYSPTVFISAPQLENFDVNDNISFSKYLLKDGNSLINAKIWLCIDEYDGVHDDWVTDLFAQMSNVEYLSVNIDGLNPSCLPMFVNLSRLVLVPWDCDYWEFLQGFLKRCPNLKDLVLEHKNCVFDRNFSNSAELSACSVSHLQTVSITGFTGRRGEMEMVEYLLRNGRALITMSIHIDIFDQPHTKEELHKKLLKFDKGSESCFIKLN